MLRNYIILIALITFVLFIPSIQVFAAKAVTPEDIEENENSISDTGGEADIKKEVSGQQVYEYYQAIKSESGTQAAVIAVATLVEPILDEYAVFGLHKPAALAQLFMESSFLSSRLSREGNNPYGIKGTGYLGATNEYIDGKNNVLDLPFEAFESFEEGVRGYCRLMMDKRYLPVREAYNSTDAAKYIKECGYASDPHYVGDGNIQNRPILGILDNIKAYQLDQFVRDPLDPKIRYKQIWRDISKQTGAQFLAYWYLQPRIKEIQSELYSLGYYEGKIDGWFGQQSEASVIVFQKQYGLDADGVVGIVTYEALFPESFTAKIVIPGDTGEPITLEPVIEQPPEQE